MDSLVFVVVVGVFLLFLCLCSLRVCFVLVFFVCGVIVVLYNNQKYKRSCLCACWFVLGVVSCVVFLLSSLLVDNQKQHKPPKKEWEQYD